jgi:HD-like signal output (HDOD) protein
MRIDELLDQPRHLPTIPKVVQQLIESFGDEDVPADQIARQIATDPVMSAKLLRLANSAFFNVSRTVATVSEALRLLGFVMVRNLVLGTGISAAFKTSPGMDVKAFWRHCLGTACGARWLAGRAREDGDLAFTVGLLHGIGEFVMHAGMPDAMKQLDAALSPVDGRRSGEERRCFGYDFAQVGAELARRWKFPEAIASAMGGVPAPLETSPFSPAAALVHLAAWRVRQDSTALAVPLDEDPCPGAVCGKLGIPVAWVELPAGGEAESPADEDAMPPAAELTRGLEDMLAA